MRAWLARIAWRLLGFKILPIHPGSIVVLSLDSHVLSPRALDQLCGALYARLRVRGAELIVLPEGATIDTVLQAPMRTPAGLEP